MKKDIELKEAVDQVSDIIHNLSLTYEEAEEFIAILYDKLEEDLQKD